MLVILFNKLAFAQLGASREHNMSDSTKHYNNINNNINNNVTNNSINTNITNLVIITTITLIH